MMFRLSRLLLLILLPSLLAAGDIGPAGVRLAARYDAMDVEHHWLPGRSVDWRTGDPDGRTSRHTWPTHCNAFVATACERLGVFIPILGVGANEQARWLAKDGASQGWREVASPFEAQRLANEGQIVVAAYPSPPPHEAKPGHVALVRPSAKSDAEIQEEGPQVVQAGGRNAASTPLKTGFHFHREAWKSADDFQVRFYAHPVP
jgi:hypothetical protein